MVIHYDIEPLGDFDSDQWEEILEYLFEDGPPKPSKKYFANLTLEDIVNLAPQGAKLSDIFLRIEFPRMCDYVEVSFNYAERNMEAEEQAYQKALEEYNQIEIEYQKELIEYNNKLEEYNEWKRQKEVSELEEKLAKLKK